MCTNSVSYVIVLFRKYVINSGPTNWGEGGRGCNRPHPSIREANSAFLFVIVQYLPQIAPLSLRTSLSPVENKVWLCHRLYVRTYFSVGLRTKKNPLVGVKPSRVFIFDKYECTYRHSSATHHNSLYSKCCSITTFKMYRTQYKSFLRNYFRVAHQDLN